MGRGAATPGVSGESRRGNFWEMEGHVSEVNIGKLSQEAVDLKQLQLLQDSMLRMSCLHMMVGLPVGIQP